MTSFAITHGVMDNFKRANDAAGHLSGDETLRAVSTILQDRARAADLTARLFSKEGEYEGMSAILRAAYLHCPFMPPELCFAGFEDDDIPF